MALLTVTTHAQKFHIGLKAGADADKINGQPFNSGFSFGYQGGVFAEIGLSKKWWVQPEILINQENKDTSKNFSDIYQFNKVSSIQLTYLSIPLLLNYKILPFISLQAGPCYGILINHNASLIQNGQNVFKNGDFSLLGGVQLQFARFRVYGRYAIGLDNINGISNKDNWKSQSVQAGIGFSFL
jgi:hypothetical protein